MLKVKMEQKKKKRRKQLLNLQWMLLLVKAKTWTKATPHIHHQTMLAVQQ